VDYLVLIALVVLLYLAMKAVSKKPTAAPKAVSPKRPRARTSMPLPNRLLPAHEERDLLAQRLLELTHEHELLRERARTAAQRARASSEELEALREENERLRALLEEQKSAPEALAEVEAPEPEPATPPEAALSTVVPGDLARAQVEAVGRAFAAWCNQGSALVSRYFMFERALQRALPEAVVEPVYRDPAAVRPVFREAADGPEYWLVRLGTSYHLLPQPQTAEQFRELVPIFEGEATPKRVTAVVPALLATDGGLLVLDRPGSVH